MNKASNIPFITWLRTSSAILILLCHYCSQCDTPYVSMLTMVFNIGVYLFIIMSGFLVGYKGIKRPWSKWYKRRMARIFIPFWMFLLVLAVIHVVKGMSVFTKDWLLIVFGLQGTVVNVSGAGHTWFLSVLLLCYFLSPFILILVRKVADSHNLRVQAMAVLAVCLIPILYAFFEEPWVYTVFSLVSLYILSCVYGMYYNPDKRFGTKEILLAVLVVGASFFLRFAAKLLLDGTILYERIVVPYSQSFAACATVYLFEAFCSGRRIPPIVQFISDISFEIYLYHYMLTPGPISLFTYFPNWILGCTVVTAVVLPIAYAANRISAAISQKRSTLL